MKNIGGLIGLCLFLAACQDDPAKSLKIAAPTPRSAPDAAVPNKQGVVRTVTQMAPEISWNPAFCPPPAPAGTAGFSVTGPCSLQQTEPVNCQALQDDFIVAFTRKVGKGATFVGYLNVENYHGPGSYQGSEMFVAIQTASSIFRWSSARLDATVGPGEAFVVLPEAHLEGEPILTNCSMLIGPASNYQFQCAGRAGNSVVVSAAPEKISGRLQCATK